MTLHSSALNILKIFTIVRCFSLTSSLGGSDSINISKIIGTIMKVMD